MTTAETDRPASLPQRAVDAITRRLSRRGLTRRSFLTRSAVVGSALALDPTGLLLRPRTAYASVCGEATEFSEGWSAFCATVNNNGGNVCPSYSYAAGWWKIDNSTFCSGRARYIVDCNRKPNDTCNCHAADGQCDHRRVCCNNFRYGQCNTHISGTTEVVCRIVLCTPPWEWGNCTTTSRTSNTTRTHWSAALPSRTNPTPITVRWLDMGLTVSALGPMVGNERSAPDGGAWARFEKGVMTFQPGEGTKMVLGDHAATYAELGGPTGRLGYPLQDHPETTREVRYQYGRTYRQDGSIRVERYPFRDVPADSPFFDEIMWLHGAGITTGCNPPANDRFCPSRSITRGEMAAFLVRAMGLTETSEEGTYEDVPEDSIFAEAINKLTTAGITEGCNEAGTRYCPADNVRRNEMAAFLSRARELTETSPEGRFEDVPQDSPFADDINRLATAGITRGCNEANTRYCPAEEVTRAEMAAFLYRAFA